MLLAGFHHSAGCLTAATMAQREVAATEEARKNRFH